MPNTSGNALLDAATGRTLVAQQTGALAYVLYADQLDVPNSANWIVNAMAPIASDSLNTALANRPFDDTAEEGVGFLLRIPLGATNIVLGTISRAETAPAGASTVGLKLYYRQIPDDAAISTTWSGAGDGNKVLTDISIPTSTNPQYDSETIPLASFAPALVPGRTYQFELTRINPSAGVELVGDWDLLELIVSFT